MKKSGIVIILLTLVLGGIFIGVLSYQRSLLPSSTDDIVYKLATDESLNLDQFKNDYKSDAVKNIVESQRQDVLKRLGDQASTPAIFINSEKINLTSYDDLKTKINDLINQNKLPVNVEIFSDYNCLHCREFDAYLEPLKKNPIYKDKVNFIGKNLPFLKDNSVTLAYAVEAARKQGKFDDYSQHLFLRAQGLE